MDYDKNFLFYMTTKMPNPHYFPEVCIKAGAGGSWFGSTPASGLLSRGAKNFAQWISVQTIGSQPFSFFGFRSVFLYIGKKELRGWGNRGTERVAESGGWNTSSSLNEGLRLYSCTSRFAEIVQELVQVV